MKSNTVGEISKRCKISEQLEKTGDAAKEANRAIQEKPPARIRCIFFVNLQPKPPRLGNMKRTQGRGLLGDWLRFGWVWLETLCFTHCTDLLASLPLAVVSRSALRFLNRMNTKQWTGYITPPSTPNSICSIGLLSSAMAYTQKHDLTIPILNCKNPDAPWHFRNIAVHFYNASVCVQNRSSNDTSMRFETNFCVYLWVFFYHQPQPQSQARECARQPRQEQLGRLLFSHGLGKTPNDFFPNA